MHHDPRPDVVLIHCHDLGRWLPAYGMPSVPAPHLTEFAEQGIVFDNAHAAAPLCSPARGSLFTGMTPYRHGIQGLTHDAWRYREGVLTAPERLRPLGYRSALIGLQHEDVDPSVLGFDEVPAQGFLPRAHQVASATAEWLDQLEPRGRRRPLFLTVGTWEVHRPWPAEDYEPADPAAVDVPAYLPDNAATRADIAAFHGSIAQFDKAFGDLLEAIDRTLGRANTMIVFTTDHGAAFPRAKSTLYDAGTGVSFIVRPPAMWATRPGRVHDVVSHVDLLPTLIELAGGEVSNELEGESLVPLLQPDGTGRQDGAEDPGADEDDSPVRGLRSERIVFTSKTHHDAYDPKRAARSRDVAYIRNYVPGPELELAKDLEDSPTRRGMGEEHLAPRPAEELYDRRADPDELTNLVDDPAYAAIRNLYARALEDWLAATGDPVADGPVPPPPPRTRVGDGLDPLPER